MTGKSSDYTLSGKNKEVAKNTKEVRMLAKVHGYNKFLAPYVYNFSSLMMSQQPVEYARREIAISEVME